VLEAAINLDSSIRKDKKEREKAIYRYIKVSKGNKLSMVI
jgi:hypothetical protein